MADEEVEPPEDGGETDVDNGEGEEADEGEDEPSEEGEDEEALEEEEPEEGAEEIPEEGAEERPSDKAPAEKSGKELAAGKPPAKEKREKDVDLGLESGEDDPEDAEILSTGDESDIIAAPGPGPQPGYGQQNDSVVLQRLKEYEMQINAFYKIVESMTRTIRDKEEPLTPEEAKRIEMRQNDLQKRVRDLGKVSVDINKLLKITNVKKLLTSLELKKKFEELFPGVARDLDEKSVTTSVDLMRELAQKIGGGGFVDEEEYFMQENNTQFVAPQGELPKVVICGNDGSGAMPRIVVCESIKTSFEMKSDKVPRKQSTKRPVKKVCTQDMSSQTDSPSSKISCTCPKRGSKKKHGLKL